MHFSLILLDDFSGKLSVWKSSQNVPVLYCTFQDDEIGLLHAISSRDDKTATCMKLM